MDNASQFVHSPHWTLTRALVDASCSIMLISFHITFQLAAITIAIAIALSSPGRGSLAFDCP